MVSYRHSWVRAGHRERVHYGKNKKPIYIFVIIDKISDLDQNSKIKLCVEIGFMPGELAYDTEPYSFVSDTVTDDNFLQTGRS